MSQKQKQGAVLVAGAGEALAARSSSGSPNAAFAFTPGCGGSQAALEAFQSQRSGRIKPVMLDVVDETSIEGAARHIIREVGAAGLFGLVNSACIMVDGPLELIPVENFRRQFEVNVTGVFAVTRALLPALRRVRGGVVNIGALSARTTAPFFGAIAVSKAALAC